MGTYQDTFSIKRLFRLLARCFIPLKILKQHRMVTPRSQLCGLFFEPFIEQNNN